MNSEPRIALILLAILVVAALLNGFALPFAGRNARPEHIAAPLVCAAFAGWRWWQGATVIRRDAFALLSVAWVFVNGLSSWLYAPQPADSFVHVVRMGILVATFLTIANLPFRHAGHWAGAFRLWLGLGLLALAYGLLVWIVARYGGLTLPGAYHEPALMSISIKGTQLERNLFGILAASVMTVTVYGLFAQRRRQGPPPIGTGLLVTAILLAGSTTVLSLTRSAWLAVVLTAPLAYVLFDRRRVARADRPLLQAVVALPVLLSALVALWQVLPAPATIDVATAAGAGAQAAPSPPAPRSTTSPAPDPDAGSTSAVSDRLSSFSELRSDLTVNTRVQDARWALRDWLASPIVGHGTGSFGQIHGRRAGSEAWISNMTLHTMVDTGLVGLGIQMMLFALVAWRAWRSAQVTTAPQLEVGLKAMTLGFLVMMIAYQFTDGTWMALFWVHLALMVNGIYRVADEERRPLEPTSATR